MFWEYEPSKARTRYPSDEELDAFKAFCRDRFIDELTPLYVDLKRLIGLRLNNMLALTRAMVKDDGLHPGTSKRGRKQVFVYEDGQGASTGVREALNAILSLPVHQRSAHTRKPQHALTGRASSLQSLSMFCKHDGQPYTVEGFQSNWQRRMNAWVHEKKGERFWEHDIRAAAGTAADEAIQEARADAHRC